MSETAVISVNRVKIYKLKKENNENAEIIMNFLNDPESFITAILIGNNIVNVFASVLACYIAVRIFGDIGVAIATGIMTFLILVTGEIIPKRLGTRYSEKISLKLAKPLKLIVYLFRPLVVFFIFITDFFVGFFGEKKYKIRRITRDEIRAIVSMGEAHGTIRQHERKIIHRILALTDKKIKEIIVPRKKICYVDYSSTLEDAVKLMIKHGHTRLPVRRKGRIVGMVHARGLFKYSSNLKKTGVNKVLRKIMFVDENDTILEVMRRLEKSKNHMAIVLRDDEVVGLVSIENLFKEIVGEIGK